jgi:2,3-dihydroxybiphenyl 1,2-dioxygenase
MKEGTNQMRSDLQLGYVGIEVPEPGAFSGFFGEVIGLVPGEPSDGGTLTWRNDDRSHRVILEAGPADDASFLGFEAADETVLDAIAHRLGAIGFELAEGNDDDLKSRRVDRLVRTTAPWGVSVELVLGLEQATTPYASPLMPGGFLTSGVGFGHAVFATTAFAESHAFLVDGLGFEQSDWIVFEIASGTELEVRFYHCNARHHTVALAKAPFELPKCLHHIMFETNSADDVGAAFDRAWATDLAIPNGLGRHDNDRMFSFYVASTAGFMVEVGHGARIVTDGWDDNRQYSRTSLWGHQALRSAEV